VVSKHSKVHNKQHSSGFGKRRSAEAQQQALDLARSELARARTEGAHWCEAAAAQEANRIATIATLTAELRAIEYDAHRSAQAAASAADSTAASSRAAASELTNEAPRLAAHPTATPPPLAGMTAFANWSLLADRAAALGADKSHPVPAAGVRSKDAHREADARRLVDDVCAMLRVEHVGQLIPVLSQVIRVAVTVPALERLRDVVYTAARAVATRRQCVSADGDETPPYPSEDVESLPAASWLAPLLRRWGRDLQQSREFELAVTRLIGTDTRGQTWSRSRMLLMLRDRLSDRAARPKGAAGSSAGGDLENVDTQRQRVEACASA